MRRAGLAALAAAAGLAAAGASSASAAIFTVTTTNDSGAGSLRQAITSANAASGADEVRFDIPGPGAHTIAVTSPLPTITGRLKIDGATEPGFAGTPLIRIDNQTRSAAARGIDITVGQSQVRSLSITGFGTGIALRNNGANLVAGNHIGLTPGGVADGNLVGVAISETSKANTVGGTTAADRNIVSGNGDGILIEAANANVVQGNHIGTTAIGQAAVANTGDGVRVAGAAKNNSVSGNLVSGNAGSGVRIAGAGTSGNVVAGNRIGTTFAGNGGIPNQSGGVLVHEGATANTIGGTTGAARNIISGNYGAGVMVRGTGTAKNVVAGNYVGTDATGLSPLPNSEGVTVADGATRTTVGGDRSTSRNLVSGNDGYGIFVYGEATTGTVIAGNDVGLDRTGKAALPNVYGVGLLAPHTTVGGTTGARRNVISGNGVGGVIIGFGSAHDNVVQGNYIGTDTSGTARVGGGASGVRIVNASRNKIGGKGSAERNVISGMDGGGVELSEADANVVTGNFIGVDATGVNRLGNRGWGVEIVPGSDGNQIGGTSGGARNVISGNGRGGVVLSGATTGNVVQGNYIGTTANGEGAAPNAGAGVTLFSGATGNTIGGTGSGTANLIAYNQGAGVLVSRSGGVLNGNAILRNSLWLNDELGIDLVGGANDDQPAPVITSVTTTATATKIKGTLAGSPGGTPYRIEAFVSPACDPSGAGEGKQYLGAKAIKTNAAGNGTFSIKVGPLPSNFEVTATATRTAGPRNTSEFSQCAVV